MFAANSTPHRLGSAIKSDSILGMAEEGLKLSALSIFSKMARKKNSVFPLDGIGR
jgi:hypothetical protein